MSTQSKTKILGTATAYGYAVKHGYTGTEEEFGEEQAKFAENAKKLRETKEEVLLMKESVEEVKTQVEQLASNAGQSATNAHDSETKAKDSETKAKDSETKAKDSETKAKESETIVSENAKKAGVSEANARQSEQNALQSANRAGTSEQNAAQSAENAGQSALNAAQSAQQARDSNTTAFQYAEKAAGHETRAREIVEESNGTVEAAQEQANEARRQAELAAQKAGELEGAVEAVNTVKDGIVKVDEDPVPETRLHITTSEDEVEIPDMEDFNKLSESIMDLADATATKVDRTDDITSGVTWTIGYKNLNGIAVNITTLQYSEIIPVSEGDVLAASNTEFRFVTAYSGSIAVRDVGVENVRTYTVPNGIDGVCLTCYTNINENPNKRILYTHKVYVRKNTPITPMGYMRKEGNLSDGQSLILPFHNVKNNNVIVFSANIVTFDSIKIGKQSNNYFITVDGTNITVTCGSDESSIYQIAHGLTITNDIQLVIENETRTKLSRIVLTSCGNEYIVENPDAMSFLMDSGENYATSIGSTLKDCVLSWTSRNINKPIWLFGDSYFSWYPERWVYYLARDGFTESCMLNGYAGEASRDSLTALENLLAVACPKIVVWCIGMNDPDGDGTTNANWKECFEKVVSLSKKYGFELVLYTTPTTPTKNNEPKNNIVRSSGYRFVDADTALRIDENGNWKPGTLADNVHPTIQGAKILYNRFLADIPELTAK